MTLAIALAALLLAAQSGSRAAPPIVQATEAKASYRLSGVVALRPSRIRDDGYFTYIEWPAQAELPAVFTRGSDGAEVIAEGTMLGEIYVLDRVHTLLIFRIDRQMALARRQVRRR